MVVVLSKAELTNDFRAIRMGDVNGNWEPAPASPGATADLPSGGGGHTGQDHVAGIV